MKKVLVIIGIVLAIFVALYTIVFITDYNRCSNLKLPIFAVKVKDDMYYGLGYSVKTESINGTLSKVEMYILNKYITGAITDYEDGNIKEKDFGRVIMVNDKLYYDTGKKSDFVHTCGTMDGYILSNVSPNTLPTKNNEANFEGDYGYQYGTSSDTIELKIDNEWYVFKLKEEINVVLTLDDKITDNSIWCGTFQLIWNDLKNELVKQDIKFEEHLEVVDNLNKETFTTNDIPDKYYYKKYGTPTLELKAEIEKEIKKKFNEESDILDEFKWEGRDPKDFFLYTMLKKEFEFKNAFEKLENGKFGDFENVEYFGIKENSSNKLREQVKVLYYNSKNDFAILLETKGDDEVILCKKPKGDTFNEIYNNILNEKGKYKYKYSGNLNMKENETLKIPNIEFKEKKEFKEIENKTFLFANGEEYSIEKALQVIEFKLDRKGGKVKSEAGMMVKNEMASLNENIREFSIDDTFAIFLVQDGKNVPYFASKISDIKDF